VIAVVVAFDGLVADTLELRAESLRQALHDESVAIESERLRSVLPGRTFPEATAALVGDEDQTLIDVVALRAQQGFSRRLAHGASLALDAGAFVDQLRAAGTSLVLRTDSLRRDVERVLQLTDLDLAFLFVRCPDDIPRARGVSTLESSYAAISARLDALGVGDRRAIEYTACAADVARHVLGQAYSTQRLVVDASRH
jgi:beta-phosphoglucomutase-like phosphatase (HAD superfamily)